jgi:tetratricopeptide (TPR) repeat protein
MTDDKKFPELGDLDWDQALEEWEKNTLVPEVARDADSPPPGAAADAPSSKPFYAPPPSSSEGQETLIGTRPADLKKERPSKSRGGLGQLFSKGEGRTSASPPPGRAAPPPGFDSLFDAPTTTHAPDSEPPAVPDVEDAPTATNEPLHAPAQRLHDPESETQILHGRPPSLTSEAAERHPADADDEMPTRMVSVNAPAPAAGARERRPPPPVAPAPELRGGSEPPPPRRSHIFGMDQAWPDERAARTWLDDDGVRALVERAEWLEVEARACTEPADQARGLLVVSELFAICAEFDRAYALACEARDLAPTSALALRQARHLTGYEPVTLVEALAQEAAHSATAAARAHATLYAADILRLTGDTATAAEHWDRARKLDPSDVRAPTSLAALALGQGDHTNPSLHLAENSELEAVERAVGCVLRLRGVERAGVEMPAELEASDAARRARQALEDADAAGAANAIGELARLVELSAPAHWVASALAATTIASRRNAVRWLKLLMEAGDTSAQFALASRGVELADGAAVEHALTHGAFGPMDEAVLSALFARPVRADQLPLADDVAAATAALGSIAEPSPARADLATGAVRTRSIVKLARTLASGADDDAARQLAVVAEAPAVRLELANQSKDFGEVVDALSAWANESAKPLYPLLTAATLAERSEDRARALDSYRRAFELAGADESLARIVAELDPEADLVAMLCEVADATQGPQSAIVRIEAATRADNLAEPALAELFGRAHASAPEIGLGAFLAERVARKSGDVDEVVRWIQERRQHATDPLEAAVDSVREALLVADRSAETATARLEEAHRARPDDVALRELYERISPEVPSDAAAWRERRAERAAPEARGDLLVEAALEAAGSTDALAAARRARAASPTALTGVLLERAEVEAGDVERLTEVLEGELAGAPPDVAVDLLARLADVAAHGKRDVGLAAARHRSLLEREPARLASLRFLEHEALGAGRDDDLADLAMAVGRALDRSEGGEVQAHAWLAARLQLRHEGGWARTGPMAELACAQGTVPLWALRAKNAHARYAKDDHSVLETTLALLARAPREQETAALLLRASEASARLDRTDEAVGYLERAVAEDPGDVVAWGFLAEARGRKGDTRAAAEACESLARTSSVSTHQLMAWYDAARLWLDEVKDLDRGVVALEQAASIDVAYEDVFPRLSALYGERKADAELAALLERRLDLATDPEERVTLEVDRARALVEMGETGRARAALEAALATRPDHTTALAAFGDLSAKEGDWAAAEQAWVRLARLLPSPAEQRAIYERLGELYSHHAVNLSRAEVALREVLKRAPTDLPTLHRLVDVYKRQNDVPHAVEMQQQIIQLATDPDERLERMIELALVHETVGREPRKAEQALETARKEFPTSVRALRALAEFYQRQKQMPAMHILLDRAAGDARRAFAAGRFLTSLFEILATAYELRGKGDAAKVVHGTLAAIDGQRSGLRGAETRALDPRLDELLAPETLTPAIRALLAKAGDALDVAYPLDLRGLRATQLPHNAPIVAMVSAVAASMGMSQVHVFSSPQLGRSCLPCSSNPPTLVVGEGLLSANNDLARAFLIVRSLKLVGAQASTLVRLQSSELGVLLAAFFMAYNPGWAPQGMGAAALGEATRRLAPAIRRGGDPEIGVLALEAAGTLGNQASALGPAALAWANRTALLAVGDPGAAIDAIAWSLAEDGAPTGAEERAAWIARTVEVRELLVFSVSDAYSEARARVGLR